MDSDKYLQRVSQKNTNPVNAIRKRSKKKIFELGCATIVEKYYVVVNETQ